MGFRSIAAASLALGTTLLACGVETKKDAADTKTAVSTSTITDTSTALLTSTTTASQTASATETTTDSATDTETTGELPEILKDKVRLKLVTGKRAIYVEDRVYTASCNQFFFGFFVSKEHPDCTAIEVDTKFNYNDGEPYTDWTLKSPDKTADITAKQDGDEEQLTINGEKFFCLLFDGDTYDDKGEEVIAGSHIILSKTGAAKPSKLESVSYFFPNNADLCEALE